MRTETKIKSIKSYRLCQKEGNQDELGTLVGGLRKPYPHFNIVGGCCGTDMRHMKRILEEAKSAY